MTKTDNTRTYLRKNCVVFRKTDEKFGGLSNMAPGFPLKVNDVRILTSEVLYQICRFPHLPDVQQLLIKQQSPMTAKMKSKRYRKETRPDWYSVRLKIMRWCLRVKLVQNWDIFAELLRSTGDAAIIEESKKDPFWGAKPIDDKTLEGINALGRLLMELRQEIITLNRDTFHQVKPPAIPDFLLLGKEIGFVETHEQGGTCSENLFCRKLGDEPE